MKAQIIRAPGGPEVFELVDLPTPTPGPGEVLVRQHASSVNPVDCKNRAQQRPTTPDYPAVLGCDVAGVVEALGEGVTDFQVGDAVYGCAGGVKGLAGAYAEYINCDTRLLAPKPEGLDFRAAAALPLVTLTAWEGLQRAGIGRGQQVLIHGGTGGVGHIALQLAKEWKARVYTTVSSPEKADIAHSLGAEATIDYHQDTVANYVSHYTDGHGFDVVFDASGKDRLDLSFEAARLNGHVVTIVSQYTADLSLMHMKGLSLHVVLMLIPMLHNIGREVHGDILRRAGELVTAGKLRPLVDPGHFSLAELSKAHAHLESGAAIGKVVVDI